MNIPDKIVPEKINHISKYDNYEVLYRLSKFRSPISILFCSRNEDESFITVVKYKTKSGYITSEPWILEKDVERWLAKYENQGFKNITEI